MLVASDCNEFQFQCHSNGACVDLSAKCNRRADCDDGSDEADCGEKINASCTS